MEARLSHERAANGVAVDDRPGKGAARKKRIHGRTRPYHSGREGTLLIYGAAGYTGRLIAEASVASGLRPILCGRDAAQLAPMAKALRLEYRVAPLDDAESLQAALRDVAVVIHAAGPFSATSRPMVDGCLRAGTHYLDIAGEIPVIEALVRRDAEARRRDIMIMPGVGFDVVPSDCLAAHVASRLPGTRRLALGVAGLTFATRGSAKTLVEHAGFGVKVRRDGAIVGVPPGALSREFDYGAGPRRSVNVSWGDVSSAYYTTGVPNIEVYFEATPRVELMMSAIRHFGWALQTAPWQAWLRVWADLLGAGPSAAERAARRMVIVAEAEDEKGRRLRSRLRTPEAYAFTAVAAPAIARRVLAGDLEVGFQTPGRVYGGDFVLSLANVSREDF